MLMKSKKRLSKKRLSKKYSKKKKINKRGGGQAIAAAKEQFQKITGDDKCDLTVPYVGNLEKVSYDPAKLMKKLEKTDLLEKEGPEFQTMFKKNMKKFCGNSKENKYLKFCSNLFNCVKEPRLFYEVLNDIFDLDINDSPKLENFYKKKKKLTPDLSTDDFYKQQKELRCEAVSEFLVNVIFKTINDFESKNPSKDKNPTDNIFLKKKFETLFVNIQVSVNFKKETVEDLKKKLLDKETVIGDYYTASVFSSDDNQSLNENKDERSGNFIFIVIGGILTTLFLKMNFFAAPPTLTGSIS
jgi:hypothetical protein